MNRVVQKLDAVWRDPVFAATYVASRAMPGYFRRTYQAKSKRAGLKGVYLILSFDCDTEKDIEVVEGVHQRLCDLGICPSYAVPGQLLEQGRSEYGRIAASGAEFINHGYLSHTDYLPDSRGYISTLFYDQLSPEEVSADIRRGHQACIEVLGQPPLGFRTPHFGTYGRKEQLRHLYSVLSELGYQYSSSTTPVSTFWNGAIQQVGNGILELPVSGCFDFPARILDSWGFRFSPTRTFSAQDYVTQFDRLVNWLTSPGNVGILNIYADPSQVYDWDAFFECMAKTQSLHCVSFKQLISEFNS